MAEAPPEKPPVVFISYSHDSKEHKEWVAKLAISLVEKGVDVLCDQFDLGPGDDVPKFMERAVTEADRVLMICSEAYVRKADDGKGGVGYEAMIVTSELVRDLGTNKFIPIIRQSGKDGVLPKCISTRLYVDLGDSADVVGNFESLLREIHRTPKLKKPKLGVNPFPIKAFEGKSSKLAREDRSREFATALADPAETYGNALEIIRSSDRIAWRKLLLAASESGAEGIVQWKKKHHEIPQFQEKNPADFLRHAKAGVDAYMPFIACLVAGAESALPDYAGQLSWLDTLRTPANWEQSGSTYWVDFPETVIFISQAIVGGMLMESGVGDAAYRLATTKLLRGSHEKTEPLFAQTRLNGWPDSLNHSCTIAWRFLNMIIDENKWLAKAFGNVEETRSAIASYYFLMTFLNFISLAKTGQVSGSQALTSPATVPLCFLTWEPRIVEKGYRLLMQQADLLREILSTNGLDVSKLQTDWAQWMQETDRWMGNVYSGYWPRYQKPHSALPADLGEQKYEL